MQLPTLKDVIGDYEDIFNPIASFIPPVDLQLPLVQKNKQIIHADNGFILRFHYKAGTTEINTTRIYATEDELEVGAQELELEFDNLLREK